MKNIKTILVLLIPAMLLFAGCPSGVAFSAADNHAEKIDTKLIGDWATDDYSADFGEMKIEKKDNYNFTVNVGEVSDDYEEEGTGYTVQITTISGVKFLSAKTNSKKSSTNYIYHYEFEGSNLVTYSIAFTAETKKSITSTATLREEIEKKVKDKNYKRPSNKTIWKKK